MELATILAKERAADYRLDADRLPEIDRMQSRPDLAADQGVYCFGLEYQANQIYRQLHHMGAVKGSLRHEI